MFAAALLALSACTADTSGSTRSAEATRPSVHPTTEATDRLVTDATDAPTDSPELSTPSPKPKPTPTPAPTPKPTAAPLTFDGGDLIVGTDVKPGTYRTRETSGLCYWERLSGFGGTLDEIIANGTGSGYFVVTIGKGDAGFSTSGCSTWTSDLSSITHPGGPIEEDGTYIVGKDIAPGTWRSKGGGGFGCYAARLSGFGGTLNQVITNDISTDGGLIMTIHKADKGFETSGCGTWTKVK